MYGLSSCDSCRKARRWLDANGVAYRYHDVRADGLDTVTLARLARLAGWSPLVNRRSTTWRALAADERDDLDQERAISLIAQHPTLMKRPVLVLGKKALVGFDEQAWRDLTR